MERWHEEEGIQELTKHYVPYFSTEGWKYTLAPLMAAEEALALIGL